MVALFLAKTQNSIIRGRIEDTTLEAKAKDTKKSVAKAKDQGHKAEVIYKKKLMNKNVFAQKFFKFSGNFKRSPGKKMSSKFFSQPLWRSSRRNKIVHDLGSFSTSQKIVLSSSRERGIFKDLLASRPRTPNCVLEEVLEAKDVLEDSTSKNYLLNDDKIFAFTESIAVAQEGPVGPSPLNG